jgi:hypothetical protein
MNDEIRQLEMERDALLRTWKPLPPEADDHWRPSPWNDDLWRRVSGWLSRRVPWHREDR